MKGIYVNSVTGRKFLDSQYTMAEFIVKCIPQTKRILT
jgi:hypothetical protein